MTAHRYWRITCLKADGGSVFAIAEVGFNIIAGGSTVTTGGTASASDSTFGAAANAFDGNVSNFWAAGSQTSGVWLQYDFGSGNSKAIVEAQLWARNDGSDQNQMPAEFQIQWSDNGTTFTTVDHCFKAGWTSGQAIRFTFPTFSVGASHKNWGIEINAATSSAFTAVGLAEFGVHATVGGSTVLTGGTAAATTNDGTNIPSHAFDGNLTTFWSSNGTQAPGQTLTYAGLATAQACAEVALTSNPTNPGQADPTSFNIICSDDGVNWATEFGVTGVTWSGTQATQTFANSGPAPAESIAGAQTLFGTTQAGTLTDTPVNESIAGAQTLGAVFQSAAIFKPGTAGTGLRQFSTFGG